MNSISSAHSHCPVLFKGDVHDCGPFSCSWRGCPHRSYLDVLSWGDDAECDNEEQAELSCLTAKELSGCAAVGREESTAETHKKE